MHWMSPNEANHAAQSCAAANPAGASRLQSLRPVRRVAELGSLGRMTCMEIRPLSKEEFLGTFCEPMRRLAADESYRPVPLKDYVVECIQSLGLPTTLDDIEIHHVYQIGRASCRERV